jgi:Protein of unknown function (DUF4239)
MVDRIWHEDVSNSTKAAPSEASLTGAEFYQQIEGLKVSNDIQRAFKTRIVQATDDLVQARLLIFAELDNSIPAPFLIMLTFWLTIIFASFSLFVKPNAIVIAALMIFALSASSAIFLILELNQPFTGLMKISSEPVRRALASADI